jgi:hypothetical protein
MPTDHYNIFHGQPYGGRCNIDSRYENAEKNEWPLNVVIRASETQAIEN